MAIIVKPNGDIVGAVKPVVEYDEKFRARRMTLETPFNAEYTVSFDVEVQKRTDGEVVSTLPAGKVDRAFYHVATEMVTFTDPQTGETHTISIAALALGIQQAFTNWLVADRS